LCSSYIFCLSSSWPLCLFFLTFFLTLNPFRAFSLTFPIFYLLLSLVFFSPFYFITFLSCCFLLFSFLFCCFSSFFTSSLLFSFCRLYHLYYDIVLFPLVPYFSPNISLFSVLSHCLLLPAFLMSYIFHYFCSSLPFSLPCFSYFNLCLLFFMFIFCFLLFCSNISLLVLFFSFLILILLLYPPLFPFFLCPYFLQHYFLSPILLVF